MQLKKKISIICIIRIMPKLFPIRTNTPNICPHAWQLCIGQACAIASGGYVPDHVLLLMEITLAAILRLIVHLFLLCSPLKSDKKLGLT
jgi:hypothetical protein